MTKSKTFLQIVLATTITILSVVAIASATTIGTNISTGGTLAVTGASTLTGNVTAAGTLAVTGVTTLTGQLNFINASSTGWIKSATINSDTGAISFGDDNLTTTGTLTVSGATTLSGNNLFSGISSSTNALVASSTFRVYGTTLDGTGTIIETHASTTEGIFSSSGSNGIFFKKADTGTRWGYIERLNLAGLGFLSGFHFRKQSGDFGNFIGISDVNGNDMVGMNDWEGLFLGSNDVNNASSVDFIVKGGGEADWFQVDGASGNLSSRGMAYFGLADAASYTYSAHLTVASSTEQLRLAYEAAETNYASFTVNSGGDLNINATGGDVGIGSSTPSANLSVGADTSATTTVDFAKPCFRMTTDDGTTLYYWPCIVNCGNDGGWATSTTSCF